MIKGERSRKCKEQLIERAMLSSAERYFLIVRRKNVGIRLKQLARRIGITVTALDNYESGIRRPPLTVLKKWRATLIKAAGERLVA